MIRYTSVQRFSLHDGPGIRTTLFLQGCNLRCPWCSNPENVFPEAMSLGIEKSWEEILPLLVKDRDYYQQEGGVTFSGGEPLLQAQELMPLAEALVSSKVHVAIETALHIDFDSAKNLLDVVDLVIIDLKVLDEMGAQALGGNLETFIRSVDSVFDLGKRVWFRVPLIVPEIVNAPNFESIYRLVSRHPPERLELLNGHNLAREKYRKLGLPFREVKALSGDELSRIAAAFRSRLPDVEIRC